MAQALSPKHRRMLDLNRPEWLPNRRHLLTQAAALPLLALPLNDALAQFRVEVSGAGMTQIPIAAAAFHVMMRLFF